MNVLQVRSTPVARHGSVEKDVPKVLTGLARGGSVDEVMLTRGDVNGLRAAANPPPPIASPIPELDGPPRGGESSPPWEGDNGPASPTEPEALPSWDRPRPLADKILWACCDLARFSRSRLAVLEARDWSKVTVRCEEKTDLRPIWRSTWRERSRVEEDAGQRREERKAQAGASRSSWQNTYGGDDVRAELEVDGRVASRGIVDTTQERDRFWIGESSAGVKTKLVSRAAS